MCANWISTERIRRLFAALALILLPGTALAQGTLLQAGPFTPRHAPMYVGAAGQGQAYLQDSGPASGGPPGIGLSETLQVSPSPYSQTGTGPFGTHNCEYSAPVQLGVYNYLCTDPNAGGGALITAGAVGQNFGGLFISLNGGTPIPFPFVLPNPTGINNFISATAFNAVCNGTSDDGAHLIAALTQAQSQGGGLVALPAGSTCAFGETLPVQLGSTGFTCISPGGNQAGPTTGCVLKWIGLAGGKMITGITPSGGGNYRLAGLEFQGLTLEGNGAGWGLYLQSVYKCVLDGLTFTGTFNGGAVVEFAVLQTASLAETISTQNCNSQNLTINTLGTSAGLQLDEWTNGSSGGNASYNFFANTSITVASGSIGIKCVGCDNNRFLTTRVFGATDSIDLLPYTAGGEYYPANGNLFDQLYYSGSFNARGQGTTPGCVAFTFGSGTETAECSFANVIANLDTTNGPSAPTIEVGAQLNWSTDEGTHVGTSILAGTANTFPGFVATSAISQTNTCGNDALTYAAAHGSTSAFLCDPSNLAVFENTSLASVFNLTFSGSGSSAILTFGQPVGTGSIAFDIVSTIFDGVVLPGSNFGVNIGSASENWATIYGATWGAANGSDSWSCATNITASTAGNFACSFNGSAMLTLLKTGGASFAQYTVAGLPGCGAGAKGYSAVATDLSSPTYGGTLTGGSTAVRIVTCDGTSWRS